MLRTIAGAMPGSARSTKLKAIEAIERVGNTSSNWRGCNPTLGAARSAHRSAYIFGAICPQEGKAAGLVLPFCNTDTMNLHLAAIALHVAPGAHAVLLMDQAGWHLTPKLKLPANISIVAIPSKKRPKLNPQENVWQFMRDNLAVEPRVRLLGRDRRPLLRRLEQAGRAALADHVARPPRVGLRVMITEPWYDGRLITAALAHEQDERAARSCAPSTLLAAA